MVKQQLEERCQKGYKTHPTRKTKKMYGKTYRNCVKAESEEPDTETETLEERAAIPNFKDTSIRSCFFKDVPSDSAVRSF